PTFAPASGATVPVTVTISNTTSGATIRYTTDGTDPTASSTVYSSPLSLTAATTLKARAFKSGMLDSDIATANYPASTGTDYHTADYRATFWVIDGTEANRVLSYWRAGSYHAEVAGLDGYAPGTGSTAGTRHKADYRDAPWLIDGTEANRVLSYWRAGGYHADTSGLDGYAPGSGGGTLSAKSVTVAAQPKLAVKQESAATYRQGGSLSVANSVAYTEKPLGLLWRPLLPAGWQVTAVTGDGDPEVNHGEILWTGAIPPSPIHMTYMVEVPPDETGQKEIHGQVECQWVGHSNPMSHQAGPDPMMMGAEGSGFCQISAVETLPDGKVQLSLRAEAGKEYEIQASSDFVNWNPLATAAATDGTIQILDEKAVSQGNRFYRARLLP
ncbi:MAG: chitobiase/beta-hexosaminidase C-terminal domain-containing protein, partial [Verrucomicrobiota bacterium]